MEDRQSKSLAGEEHVKSQIFPPGLKQQQKKIYIYRLAGNITPNEQL